MSTKQVNFLCFNCPMTYATIEKFSMHECVKIKQEAQVVDPRAGLAPQGDSELKIEVSYQNNEKEVNITKIESEDIDVIAIYRSKEGSLGRLISKLQSIINMSKSTLIVFKLVS